MTASARGAAAFLLIGFLAMVGPAGAVDGPIAQQPLGGEIVFQSDRTKTFDDHIYVMDADGRNVRKLTSQGRNRRPDWSPDGTKIVFSSNRGGSVEIYVMNADGSNPVQLTRAPGQDKDPAWSPDGSTIIFVSERTGNEEVWAMDPNGGNLRQLTNAAGFDRDPEWSSDGRFILFTSKRGLRKPDIWIMNADGSNQRRWSLLDDSEHGTGWHPSLPKVVYHGHAGEPRGGKLWVADVDANGDIVSRSQLTNTGGHVGDEHPVWFPDGSKVLFNSIRDGDLDIYTVDPDGSNVRALTNNNAFDCCARHR